MWVFEEKLLGVLYLIAQDWEASFDRAEFDSIRHNLFYSNSDAGQYFDYTFKSHKGQLTIQMGKEQGAGIIMIEAKGTNNNTSGLLERIDKVQQCFSAWTLDDPEFSDSSQ